MKYGVLFQGQGKYDTNFVRQLYKTDMKTKELFEKADAILGFSVSDLILNTVNTEEIDTDLAQILIFIMEYSSYQFFSLQLPEKPAAFAGHSLGEITALAVAGAIKFEDAVRLVQHRGLFMKGNRTERKQGMMAIRNVDKNEVNTLCGQVTEGTDCCVVCANYNSSVQTVISGHLEALKMVEENLSRDNCKYLKVQGAFHSPLMEEAAKQLDEYMREMTFYSTQIPVISSVTAMPYAASWSVRNLLTKQLTSPVRWVETMNYLSENGIATFVQVTDSKLFMSLDKSLPKNHIWMSMKDLCEDYIYDFDDLYHGSKINSCYRVAVLSDVLNHLVAYPWKMDTSFENIEYAKACYNTIMEQYIELNDQNKEVKEKQIRDAIECLKSVLEYKDTGVLSSKDIVNQILGKYGLEGMWN